MLPCEHNDSALPWVFVCFDYRYFPLDDHEPHIGSSSGMNCKLTTPLQVGLLLQTETMLETFLDENIKLHIFLFNLPAICWLLTEIYSDISVKANSCYDEAACFPVGPVLPPGSEAKNRASRQDCK